MAFYKIGGLWLKTDKKDRQYLTGTFTINGENIRISIYQNELKEAENHPDWLIYEQKFDKKFLK